VKLRELPAIKKKRDHTKTKPVIGFKENYQELGNIYMKMVTHKQFPQYFE